MTLRHQLTVSEMVLRNLRERAWTHARPEDIAEWDRRLSIAYAALDHGEAAPMPDEARTEPSQEAIEQAQATDRALRNKARRRAQEIKRQMPRSAGPRPRSTSRWSTRPVTSRRSTSSRSPSTWAASGARRGNS